MGDYVIRGTAADGQILAFAADTTEMVEEARRRHGLTPTATAALGRTLTAAAMMACQLKNSEESVTIQLEGSGPIGRVVAVADGEGRVRGYVDNPEVDLPLNKQGKLDVGGAIGIGVMNITKDLGLKEPYTGSTHLVSSEVAEDLAYYFTVSEQIPSAVSLGVMVNKDGTVWTAGGFILQMMPGATEAAADLLQERVMAFPRVTEYLAEGHSPEELLKELLGDMDLVIMEKKDTDFRCNCSREKVSAALLSIGAEELQQLEEAGEPVEMGCHFCNEKYVFSPEEVKALREQALQK